jgi:hypothetical protein
MARPWGYGKPTASSFLTVDIRWLKRRGLLEAGTRASIELSLMGRPRGKILLAAHDIDVELVVGDRRQYVPIVTTNQPLGGERPWFECDCGERAAILYGPRFLCRKCRGIAYQSQRESRRHQGLARAQKIRKQLGGSLSMMDPFPQRPKGMHASTYERLYAQYLRFERANIAAMSGYLMRLRNQLR